MKVSKRILRQYPYGSPEYVVLHALWRKQRGKGRPVSSLYSIKNPKKALLIAQKISYIPINYVSYLSDKIPESYSCTDCGVRGVKLWLHMTDTIYFKTLKCFDCTKKNQSEDINMNSERQYSRYTSYDFIHMLMPSTFEIGQYVPAIPTENMLDYWRYNSAPKYGLIWWGNLPLRLSS